MVTHIPTTSGNAIWVMLTNKEADDIFIGTTYISPSKHGVKDNFIEELFEGTLLFKGTLTLEQASRLTI